MNSYTGLFVDILWIIFFFTVYGFFGIAVIAYAKRSMDQHTSRKQREHKLKQDQWLIKAQQNQQQSQAQ